MNGALMDTIFWLGVFTGFSLSALFWYALKAIFAVDKHDRGHE